jgi:peptidoglycan/xylan/chitin deacetylase (PgdA/CDA1 family)
MSLATPGAVSDERIVFNFHGIGKPPGPIPSDETPYWCETDLYLRLLDAIVELRDDVGIPTEITFDDGNRSDLDIAAPALVDRKLGAMFFVCAGRLDDPRYLDAAALRALEDMGMVIGSHGHAHTNLRNSDDATLELETIGSRQSLAKLVRGNLDSFAIPFGSYDRRVLQALSEYTTIYTSDEIRAAGRGQRFVPRIAYVEGWTPATVRERATERYSFLKRQKDRLRTFAKRLR